MPPLPASATAMRRVSSLLCHAHVEMALACLKSLLDYSADPLCLRLHDDGTLTEGDLERLAAGLGELEVVRRSEADERVGELLARYPSTRAFRRSNPLALKLIDAVLLAGDGELAYCDSDVFFLRPFRDLFRFPGPAAGALFMADPQNAYSLRSWDLARDRGLRLPARVNSGLILYRTAQYDPELVERFLARPELRRTAVWEEQTAWALLGGRTGAHYFDPRRIRLPEPEPGSPPKSDLVALHFVSSRRSQLAGALAAARDRRSEPPVALESAPAPRLTPWSLAGSEVRRFLARRFD